ncbi:putative Ig domain-containing protein [Pedobacter punctiformis]|uniref:Ig domain-containing protein n=1 Tax=Pedobacter punctiformis TaxID=3004097 RepID=A0ABT4LBD5_9SPHI|nr:putative Ig domain-containing protein [Pedobacter sp. HCMS5-2]MCZ4245230.1 putative Ig domain-containing protein [Pedobacter sp. HCMS5-2]
MMKNFTSHLLKGLICNTPVFAIIILLTLLNSKSYAQTKVYANEVTVQSNVTNAANAISQSPTTFATVNSYGGVAGGLFSYNGELELKYPATVPAGTTSYVRIDFNADVLNALLGGNLGGFLANVLGNVVLGDHSFEIGARNSSGTTVISGSSTGAFSSPNLRLVKDANGFFYVAITPTVPYDRVYVKDITRALLLGATNNTKVYYAFYGTGIDPCAQAFATGYEGDGLTVDLLGLGKAGVTNSERAIDADQTNYSEVSLGALGVAGSISQNFYFETLSNAGDEFNLRFRTAPALLNAGLLNNISVTAYNGTTQVFTQPASTLLNVDLLGLLQTGQVVSVPFAPGLAFDRVKVTVSSLLNANLTQSIFIYGLTRSAGRPTFTAPASNAVSICYNTSTNLTATTTAANELRWYDAVDGGTLLATTAFNGSYPTGLLTANKTYYVAARRLNCTAESGRVPVVVTVNPAIVFNTTTLSNATVGFTYTKQINVAAGGTPNYTYTLAAGSTLPAGLSLSAAGLITGTPTVANDYTFSITATDNKGCTVTTPFNLKVTAALVLTPGALANGITGTVYTTQTIPPATGGTGPYVYAATNLPPGLTFDPATHQISGTPTLKGNYTIPVTVTDANGNSITSNYTIKVTDPLALPATTLADGVTGTVYNTQVIPSATGGIGPFAYSATGLPPGLTFNPTTREITGTPTQAGNYTVSVTVTDADGKTATTNYPVKVTDPLLLPAATLADGTVGVTYPAQTIPSATGGVGPYAYVATNLPPGLTFNPATREITGTPTQAGNYAVAVTVTDSQNKTVTTNYPVKVIGQLSLPSATLPNGVVGDVYATQTLPAVSGGTSPYTYLATNLPPGLSFNTVTREITGTPTVGGNYTISLTATDANNNKVNTDYTIAVTVKAPVAANASVCAGNPATLSVSNLQTGVTYNWYASSGSTALVTNNTGVFTTPTVSTQTIFYVEAVSGTAVSSRTAVTVSINPAAAPAVITTNNQVINSGQTTTLSATADAGNTINWYAAATGGTQLATGTSFTTPALNTTTTYYVETVNSNGCASASRVPVTVTVITGAGNPNCNAANKQNTGITGLCLLCNIDGAGNSTDADLTNYTRISLAVGVTSVGYQQLIFPSAGVATDSIRLDLATPTGLLDLGVLGNITVNVLNGSTIVKTYQLNSSLLDLKLLSGNRFVATLLAGGTYDRVEVRFGALISAISSLDIYGAQVIYPNPTITAGNQTICSGSTATLTATANGGTTLNWYSAATGGTLLGTGETFTTPALTATTTYYIEVLKGTCANATRVPVTVTVTPVLTAPVLAPIAGACQGSAATLSVSNPDAAITYRWYDAAAAGNLVFTGAVFTTPVLTANTTYYVEALQGNCTSATRTAAAVTVTPRPALPVVTVSASTVSAGQTAILTAGPSDPNVSFKWYTSANATSAVYTGDTYVTPPLTASTTYYVESVSNTSGCVSASRVQVTITVDGGGSPNPVPCESPVSQTSDVVGVALLSGVFNPNLAIDNDTQTASSLVMPVGALGAYAYQTVKFSSLSSVGDTVRMLVSTPGKLLSLGLLNGAQVTSYNGTTSNNDTRLLNNTTLLNVQLLSGDTQALITFVPTATFDGIELRLNSGLLGALASINFNYAQRVMVAPTVAAANVTACAGQTAQLSVSNPSALLTYRWYDASGTYLAGKDGTTFTTPALTANTKYYVSGVSASGCVSYRTVVNVTINPLAVVPELLSPNVNTCLTTSATFQVKNPVVGTTYNWYSNSISTTILFTGDKFITPLVTGNTSYFVEAVNSCGSASARTEATVTIGSIDIPVVTPPSVTISEGSVASLTATSSTAGATINWYDSPGAIIPVFTGETYVTPPLTATKTYYVEATVAGGCPATAKATVTVTVIPNGTPTPTPCGAATIATAKGVDGIALLADVFNPNLAVDNDVNTGSSLVMPVGALGASVYQRLGFTGGLSNVGDTLIVKITSPGKLLSLAVLPSLTLTTFNGTTSNNDGITINNPLVDLKLLSDGSEATLRFVPTAPFDGVELRLSSGLLGALTSVNLNYAQRTTTLPTVAAAAVSACQGTSATLTVTNPKANTIYKWYQGTTYQAGKDGVTFTTDPALTAGSYDFFVTASAYGCETKPIKAVVTILPPATIPVPSPTNPATTCVNTPATLSVVAIAGVTYNWYDAATGGNVLVNNNSSFTTSASLAAGNTYDYYVEAVSGSNCANPTRTKVSITVNPSSTASDITVAGNTSLCASGVAVLTASSTTVTNPVFTWYSDAALTNVVSNAAQFTTSAITVTTKFYVTVSGTNKCANAPGSAQEVTITVNPVATASDISLSGTSTICGGSAVTLTATSTTVTNPVFTWYSDAALATKVFEGATFTTGILNANTTFYVTVKGDNKCENTAATAKPITITVNPIATDADIAISGLTTICKGSTTTLSAGSTTVTNPVFTWYSDAALTTIAHTGASFTTLPLNASTTYYVTVRGDNRCENKTDAKVVNVTVNDYATAADITLNNANICSGSSVVLMASSLTVTQPVFTWYSDASLTSVVFTGPTFNIPSLTTNTTYYVTVKGANKCENGAADAKVVTVTVNPLATMTDIMVNGSTTACAGSSATLSATSATVTNPVFTWYSDAALTNVSFIGANFVTPALSANTTYYVTVKGDNKCENAPGTAKSIGITVKPIATATDITTVDATICAGTSTTLMASSATVTNPVFTWYSDAALTTVAFTGASYATNPLNTTTKFYVTVKGDNVCENSPLTAKVVTVTVNTAATAADVTISTPNKICGTGTAVINASSTTVTNPVFTWYNDASLTSVAFVGPIFTTPTLTANTTYYVTVKGANKCETTAANATVVTVIVNPLATAADVTVNGSTSVCANSSAILTAGSTTVTNPIFTWYSDAALNNVVFTGAVFTTPVLTTNTSYYVTVKGDNKCENAAANAKSVNLTVNPVASSSDIAATDATICSGSSAALVASSTTVTNPVFTWYNDASLTSVTFVGASFNTPVLTATTKYYVTVKGDNRCESSPASAKVVTVTVNSAAISDDVTLTTSSNVICGSGIVTISASSTTVTNPVFTWYNDASLTSVAFVGPTFTTPNLTVTTTYYVTVKGANKCENAAANARPITIKVNPTALASDVSVTGSTSICANAAASLTASSTTVTNPVFTWYSDAALTNAAFTGAVFTTPVLTTNTTYYVTVKGDNRCENTAANAKSISIVVNALPNNPVIASAGTSVCAGDATTLNISNAQAGVTYEWYSAATGGSLLFTGTSYTTPTLAATTDYYVLAIGTGGCNNNGGRVKITVTVNPKPTVPTVASSSVSVCTGSSAALSVLNPQTNVTYNWYTNATGGTIAGTGSTFSTPAVTANATYYVEAVSGTCSSTSRTAVNVTPLPVPVAPASVTPANGVICAGSTTILTVNNPVAGLIYRWYAASSGGTSLAEGITFTTPALTTNATYYVESIAVGGCSSPTRTAVSVTVLPILEKPVVVLQTADPGSITFAWAAVNGATGYEVSTDNGLTWVAPTSGSSGTTYLVSGLKPDQAVTIIVRAKGQIACQTSANSNPFTGKATNPLGNDVYIPNAFTPNNDGKNDIFLIYGNTIASSKMYIYTQWGQLIYQSNSTANGWDGTFKGVNQPSGVYVYMVEVNFNDGTQILRKDTVTLIR